MSAGVEAEQRIDDGAAQSSAAPVASHSSQASTSLLAPPLAQRVIWIVVALLVAKRIAYHLLYVVKSPFALATFSDGQLYELAARDILAHPPLGQKPFYLQGLYAYFLALPMSVVSEIVMGLLLQLVAAAGALYLFQRASRRAFGSFAAGLSLCVLLAAPEPAFYENKYLSVSLGIGVNILALWAAIRAFDGLRLRDVLLAGAAAGLAILGRPNLVLALPFTVLALWIGARSLRRDAAPVLGIFVLGVGLALAPMALRNQAVVGSPEVFPSHGGGIPFYIGNNPFANGRWNTAGGLLTGMVYVEKHELAKKLGISSDDPRGVDRAVGETLEQKAWEWIYEDPARFVRMLGHKFWLMVGNHRFVRDYDVRGERQLIGPIGEVGLPFGVLAALGLLGLFALARRARLVRSERAGLIAILLVALGQVVAIAIANVIIFTSAQNRAPLAVPFAFLAGPALHAGLTRVWPSLQSKLELRPLALLVALGVALQAFQPRLATVDHPSSAHFYNVGAVCEQLGRYDEAAEYFGQAARQNPRQPMFHLSLGRVLRRMGRFKEARQSLDRLVRMPKVPRDVIELAHRERGLIALGLVRDPVYDVGKPEYHPPQSPPPPLP